MAKITTVRGTVEAASPRTYGIKLTDGTWYDLASKAAGPPATLPRNGTTVELTIFDGTTDYLSWSLADSSASPSGREGEVKKQEITGTVEAISNDGLKLGGFWYNSGKFFNAPLPAAGEKVKVTYMSYPGKDGRTERRYLSAVEVLSDIKESLSAQAGLPAQAGLQRPQGDLPRQAGEQSPFNGRAERDVLIAREVALKAAVELLVVKAQAGENITLKSVKDTAEIFEAWILRQADIGEGSS